MPCTTILVGKKASYDGSTIISRNDDGGFCAKCVKVIEPKRQPRKYTSRIAHLTIELPDNPLKYTSSPSVAGDRGVWPANGINELNVAMTATETISSNPRVLGADPYVEYQPAKGNKKAIPGGIGEEDLVLLILPYIHSAREGVERLGMLLEQYGTYEPNGMAFADENEVWWAETIGGHHFIARRVKDEEIVIMPNQFGLDRFDFDDAFSEQRENMCSGDLKEFIAENHLDLNQDGVFNPRNVFGSRSDQDHIYNTPRAWFLARYFMPRRYTYDGENAEFTPESDDIPWSFVPEKKVTVEDIKYCLSSYYQGTKYNPYGNTDTKGKYRSIGVPNTDICGILQIRGYAPEGLKAIEWVSFGGGAFTACIPLYTSVSKMPKYIADTSAEVSTDYFYWASRIIAALTDAHHASAVIFTERYQNAVFNKCREVLCKTDRSYTGDPAELERANEEIAAILKKESDSTLDKVLRNASEKMHTRFNRGDN